MTHSEPLFCQLFCDVTAITAVFDYETITIIIKITLYYETISRLLVLIITIVKTIIVLNIMVMIMIIIIAVVVIINQEISKEGFTFK